MANSIYLETGEWVDKTYGNTYFASRVYVDGEQVAVLPFQYGYERMDEYTAHRELVNLGYLPKETETQALAYACRDNGIVFYRSKTPMKYRTLKAVI